MYEFNNISGNILVRKSSIKYGLIILNTTMRDFAGQKRWTKLQIRDRIDIISMFAAVCCLIYYLAMNLMFMSFQTEYPVNRVEFIEHYFIENYVYLKH